MPNKISVITNTQKSRKIEDSIKINKRQLYTSMVLFLGIEILVVLPGTILAVLYTLAFTWGASMVIVPFLVIILHIPSLLVYFIRSKNRSKRKGIIIGLIIVIGIWIISYYQAKKIPYFNFLTGGYTTEKFMALNESMVKRSNSTLLWNGNNGACIATRQGDTLTTQESLEDLVLYWNTSNKPVPIKDSALALQFLIRKLSPFLNKTGQLHFYKAISEKKIFMKYGYGTVYTWVVGDKMKELAEVSPHLNSVTIIVPKVFLEVDEKE